MSDKDETKGTPGTNPNGTPKDDSKGTPKKDKGKLYTVAQIDKLKSDAAAMGQGRAEKVANQEKEALTSELQSTKGRLDALEAQERETRLAEARGDATKMHAFQSEEALAKERRQVEEDRKDLTRQQGQLKTAQEELKQGQGTMSVAYIAASHGLKVEDLEEFSDLSPEALEKLAVKLAAAAGGKGKGEDADRQAYQALETDAEREAFVEAHPDFEPEGGEFQPDSGEGSGQGELTEKQRLDQRYPTMAKKAK